MTSSAHVYIPKRRTLIQVLPPANAYTKMKPDEISFLTTMSHFGVEYVISVQFHHLGYSALVVLLCSIECRASVVHCAIQYMITHALHCISMMCKSKSGLGLDLDLSPIFIENGLDLDLTWIF